MIKLPVFTLTFLYYNVGKNQLRVGNTVSKYK